MDSKHDVMISEILKRIPNRFLLAVAIAKRARQIKEGAKPMVEVADMDVLPVITAMQEIQADKLTVFLKEHKEEDLFDDIQEYLEMDIDEPVAEEVDEPKPVARKESKKSKSKSLAA